MLKPGDSFERYTIEEMIGQGGMGCVYRAHDPKLGRRVALKVLSDGFASDRPPSSVSDASARLVREARAAAALDHPNAVAIFDAGEHDGTPFIVMELVEGKTLRSVATDASAPISARLRQLADIGKALASAHRRGLVHRDVKPENVMIREDGMVKVLDFGIARRAGGDVDPRASTQTPALPTLTVEGVKLGTPVYMAPEQIRGDALDGRADQFSWGVVAYEMLAGRLPWRGAGDALAVMASVLTDRPDRAALTAASVPRPVTEVVLRALEKRPEDRFASMDDLLRALEAAEKGEAPPPKTATEAQQFSTAEVREVLGKAVEQQASKEGANKLGFDDLVAVAAEVGVDPEALRAASRALRAREKSDPDAITKAEQRDAWIRRQRLAFYRHAGVYVIVNAAIMILGFVLLSFTPWWIWVLPALAWGIGLAIHGLIALTSNKDDWEEHDRGVQWWHEHQRRKHEERMARRDRRDEPRRRIEELREAERARFRVTSGQQVDTGRERAAEDEALAADQVEVARRKR